MLTKHQTTYILLERGYEDRALRDELNKLIGKAGFGISKDFIKKFPTLHDLLIGLNDELQSQDI